MTGFRVFVLAVMLAVVAVPVPALAGKHRSHGGPFVSVDIFAAPYGYYPYPYYYSVPVLRLHPTRLLLAAGLLGEPAVR